MSTFNVHHGIVHGKTITLDEDTGLPDGQAVTVTVKPSQTTSSPLQPGEGLRRAFGAWADDADGLDDYLQWNRDQRKASRAEVKP